MFMYMILTFGFAWALLTSFKQIEITFKKFKDVERQGGNKVRRDRER